MATSNMVVPMSMFKHGESGFKLMLAYINTAFSGCSGQIRLVMPNTPETQPCKDCLHCPPFTPGDKMLRDRREIPCLRCERIEGSVSLSDYLGADGTQPCAYFFRNSAATALETLREAVREHLGLWDGKEDDEDEDDAAGETDGLSPKVPLPQCLWCRYWNRDAICRQTLSRLSGTKTLPGDSCVRYAYKWPAGSQDDYEFCDKADDNTPQLPNCKTCKWGLSDCFGGCVHRSDAAVFDGWGCVDYEEDD